MEGEGDIFAAAYAGLNPEQLLEASRSTPDLQQWKWEQSLTWKKGSGHLKNAVLQRGGLTLFVNAADL